LSPRTGVADGAKVESTAKQRNQAEIRADSLLALASANESAKLISALKDADPFIRSAAISALAKPVFRSATLSALDDATAEVRAGALLALRRSRQNQTVPVLRKALRDVDEQVRRIALVWIGEEALVELGSDLEGALTAGTFSPDLFKTYLAAADLLETAQAQSARKKSVWDQGMSGAQFIERVLNDGSKPATLRLLAVKMAPDPSADNTVKILTRLARTGEPALRIEAVRTLTQGSNQACVAEFREIALNRANPPGLRAEAILGLSIRAVDELIGLTNLLDDSAEAVRVEMARSLRQVIDRGSLRRALLGILERGEKHPLTPALKDQLSLALFGPERTPDRSGARPNSEEAWIQSASQDGDVENGRRVFFHPTAACSTCHRIEGRGGLAGPDLSVIGRSLDRAKLVQSILNPSRDIAPQFVAQTIQTRGGERPDTTFGI
jgi:HEAT repeat protein